MRFGRLTVTRLIGRGRQKILLWECKCACGSVCTAPTSGLRGVEGRKGKQSCGCLPRELSAARKFVHGHARTPEYRTWRGMLSRCYSTANNMYYCYGERGISVCDSWRTDFMAFLANMGTRPSTKHSIDRIDGNGNYEPSNCRWATPEEQARNKTTTRRLTHDGKTLSVPEWTETLGFPSALIAGRLKSGWSVSRSLITPPRRDKRRAYAGTKGNE